MSKALTALGRSQEGGETEPQIWLSLANRVRAGSLQVLIFASRDPPTHKLQNQTYCDSSNFRTSSVKAMSDSPLFRT